ncbi:gas vesicle protein GvpO [Pedococcus sp. 5OH_020]|jgi:Gas vesicle synthesis protein GvpO|uniref:gas vesicle protein GvpO n=1 Tax=Pedococcus sp. 5OH_020 TaxID=2989814 RepID=UPI0022E9D15F|nr:gas vesicle protein [Pedococcus sp. 5OH_020]
MADHVSLRRAGAIALDAVGELVGCPAEGVTGIHRADGEWRVTVEVLEVERVPETTDVMASYEVQVDLDGNVTGYTRLRRYLRAEVDES